MISAVPVRCCCSGTLCVPRPVGCRHSVSGGRLIDARRAASPPACCAHARPAAPCGARIICINLSSTALTLPDTTVQLAHQTEVTSGRGRVTVAGLRPPGAFQQNNAARRVVARYLNKLTHLLYIYRAASFARRRIAPISLRPPLRIHQRTAIRPFRGWTYGLAVAVLGRTTGRATSAMGGTCS